MPNPDELTKFDRRTRKISLVVSLIDDYTGRRPIGTIKVFLKHKQRKWKPIKNQSGYYVFPGIPEGDYEIGVESQYYFADRQKVKIPKPKSKKLPVTIHINMKPQPFYPFSSSASLIRGRVKYANNKWVNGAEVKIKNKVSRNFTTKKGEFVLYFNYRENDDPITEEQDKKKFIIGKTDKEVTLKAKKGDKEKEEKIAVNKEHIWERKTFVQKDITIKKPG